MSKDSSISHIPQPLTTGTGDNSISISDEKNFQFSPDNTMTIKGDVEVNGNMKVNKIHHTQPEFDEEYKENIYRKLIKLLDMIEYCERGSNELFNEDSTMVCDTLEQFVSDGVANREDLLHINKIHKKYRKDYEEYKKVYDEMIRSQLRKK